MTLLDEYTNYQYGDFVQMALWSKREFVTAHPTEPKNDLAVEATEFQNYIAQLNKNEPTQINYNNAVVSFNDDGQYYMVGPINIDYLRAVAQIGSRQAIQFSGIKNIELQGFNGITKQNQILTNWSIEYTNARNLTGTNQYYNEYPFPGEEFYFKISYSGNEDIIEFTNAKVTLEQVHATATYDTLSGTYKTVSWGLGEKPVYSAFGKIGAYFWLYPASAIEHQSQGAIVVLHSKKYKEYIEENFSFEPGRFKFTMELEGIVWKDGHQAKQGSSNGLYEKDLENGIVGVEVTVYNIKTGAVAKNGYGQICNTLTNEEGKYKFEKVKVGKYNVEFKYDGQTYITTKSLVGTGVPKNGVEANTNSNWDVNSKGQEDNNKRYEFNKKFEKIGPNTTVRNQEGQYQTLNYYTQANSSELFEKGKSYIQTTKNGYRIKNGKLERYGEALSEFKMPATTVIAGLSQLPLDNNYYINEYINPNGEKAVNIQITDRNNNVSRTEYNPIYPYMRHINLGLVERAVADFALKKDVNLASVTVNEKEMIYKYNNRLENYKTADSFDIKVKSSPEYENVVYNNAIYKSDYNFRIADYKDNSLNTNSDVVSTIQGTKYTDQELKVFVKYRIVLKNQSEIEYGTINDVVDYFDPTYSVVANDTIIPIQGNGAQAAENKIVAYKSTYETAEGNKGEVNWNVGGTNNGYKVMHTSSLKDVYLPPNGTVTIDVTFEVDKSTDKNGLNNAVKIGLNENDELKKKNNVVEIYEYSTYEKIANNYTVTGKIDVDSRPGSAIPGNKDTYEDDTDKAPTINIYLQTDAQERKLNGIVWEDERTETLSTKQIVGNGKRENNESLINGATIQLIELVNINGKDYEYIWREMSTGDNNYQYVGNDGIIYSSGNGNSSRTLYNFSDITRGQYRFESFVTGNFIVRFKYGDTLRTVKPSSKGGDNDKSYNGQDYKSTAYKKGFNLAKEEWSDISNADIMNARLSDARDDEARRLDVIAYSKTIDNDLGHILVSADNNGKEGYYNESKLNDLIANTWMYADTAKMKIQVELNKENLENTESIPKYIIKDVDFGLEQRPITNMDLEKQIKRIQVTLSNGTKIIDTNENSLIKNVQGWKRDINNANKQEKHPVSIYMDEEIMQGAKVQVDYILTVINNSEIDTAGEIIKNIITEDLSKDEIINIATGIRNLTTSTVRYEQIGKYLGDTYYTGEVSGNSQIVKTKVDEIIDYVDNNIVYRQEDNNDTTNNHSWKIIDIKTYPGIENRDPKRYNSAGIEEEPINQIVTTQDTTDEYLKSIAGDNKEITTVELTVSKQLSQGNSEDALDYYNIAEIIRYTNEVGRRDPENIPADKKIEGNIGNPPGEIPEDDTDDTPPIKIIPPFGDTSNAKLYIAIGGVTVIAFIIIGCGIVIIKRKILK